MDVPSRCTTVESDAGRAQGTEGKTLSKRGIVSIAQLALVLEIKGEGCVDA